MNRRLQKSVVAGAALLALMGGAAYVISRSMRRRGAERRVGISPPTTASSPIVSPRPVAASGAATQSVSSFRLALPGYRFVFPRDHAAHPPFATEWWYYTGHLQARDERGKQRHFGYQLTFFRQALKLRAVRRQSKWAARDIIFAHLALTDETRQQFYFTDRIARAALGLAGAAVKTPHIWLGDWSLRFARGEQRLRASGTDASGTNTVGNNSNSGTPFALDLTQRALEPPVIHGQNGVSQKAAGHGRASHYYSFCRLQTHGTLRLGDERFKVTGQSWFDHEFGSNQLAPGQVGWDWFSLQLSDGRELMLYRMRLKDGGTDPFSSGTIVERDGRTRHLKRDEFHIESRATWRSPQSGALYPSRWRVTLPREGIVLDIVPVVANQELRTRRSTGINYWEGSIRMTGAQRGQALSGAGYVELTGYDKPFAATF